LSTTAKQNAGDDPTDRVGEQLTPNKYNRTSKERETVATVMETKGPETGSESAIHLSLESANSRDQQSAVRFE